MKLFFWIFSSARGHENEGGMVFLRSQAMPGKQTTSWATCKNSIATTSTLLYVCCARCCCCCCQQQITGKMLPASTSTWAPLHLDSQCRRSQIFMIFPNPSPVPVPPIHLSKAQRSLSLSNPQVLCICQATLRPASSSKIKYKKKVQKMSVSQRQFVAPHSLHKTTAISPPSAFFRRICLSFHAQDSATACFLTRAEMYLSPSHIQLEITAWPKIYLCLIKI